MKKQRSKSEIIFDMLIILQREKEAKKTRIRQKANLDWQSFQRYFNFLSEEGFITKCSHKPDCYEITGNGEDFLKRLKKVREMLHQDNS